MPTISPIAPATDYAEDVIAYIVDVQPMHRLQHPTRHLKYPPIVAVKSHIEAVPAHMMAATTHMYPFEPALTTYEKWLCLFFEIAMNVFYYSK